MQFLFLINIGMYNNYTLRRRVVVASCLTGLIAVVLVARLFFVQVVTSRHLQLVAAEQWYRDLPLTAARGNIYDINGRVLAESVNTFNVYVRPVNVENSAHVTQLLSSLLNLDYNKLYDKVTKRTVSEWLIKMQVQKDVAMRIISANLKGIYLAENTTRYYPFNSLASQILGYTSIDGVGQEGVESFYNNILKGTNGKAMTQADLKGRELDNTLSYYIPSIAGVDMTLNIDYAIQSFLQSALTSMYNDNAAKQTWGMVYDNTTGAVVAQATYPNYNLNELPRDNLGWLIEGIKNQPVVTVLEPGSTFKLLTLAAAIEEGLTNEGELFNCPGFRIIDGERVKCWKTTGHGTVTLSEGVAKSCNCVFMDLGVRLGVDRFYAYMQKFGVGTKTGIDFSGESSGLVLPKETVRTVDLARIAFGQAVAVTPVQLQSIAGALVGGGVLYTPQVASSFHKDGKTVKNIQPVIRQRIVSEQTSKRIADMTRGAVLEGSGKGSYVDGYFIGGKTGTAQKYNKDGQIDVGKYISSYFGYCVIQGACQYSVMLFVDEPRAQGYYGGVVAAPYAKPIFENIFSYKRVAPSRELLNHTLTIKNIKLPSLVGLSVEEAEKMLQQLGLFVEIDGDGNKANGCIPAAGSLVAKGDVVVIMT
ncbi:MAG: penicillin-binding transpeptidase domain-containing protein [Firmicutes bacterium]|nr:penicillin-binding transpeptidase domain-containing protein [Bacillota bacterium]